ncbi:hypothetical protein [Demequina sp. NBRC 110051]|uniref:hypothetical protein n=1 Tax=Demequina sp. NBRC 110051 TaxID=1570340 RepID=UPI0009FE06E9|nr:hypothetical protein [Demequina sp. NBRC 110051]
MKDKYGHRQLSTGWSLIMAGVAGIVGMAVVIGIILLSRSLTDTEPAESPTASAAVVVVG